MTQIKNPNNVSLYDSIQSEDSIHSRFGMGMISGIGIVPVSASIIQNDIILGIVGFTAIIAGGLFGGLLLNGFFDFEKIKYMKLCHETLGNHGIIVKKNEIENAKTIEIDKYIDLKTGKIESTRLINIQCLKQQKEYIIKEIFMNNQYSLYLNDHADVEKTGYSYKK